MPHVLDSPFCPHDNAFGKTQRRAAKDPRGAEHACESKLDGHPDASMGGGEGPTCRLHRARLSWLRTRANIARAIAHMSLASCEAHAAHVKGSAARHRRSLICSPRLSALRFDEALQLCCVKLMVLCGRLLVHPRTTHATLCHARAANRPPAICAGFAHPLATPCAPSLPAHRKNDAEAGDGKGGGVFPVAGKPRLVSRPGCNERS